MIFRSLAGAGSTGNEEISQREKGELFLEDPLAPPISAMIRIDSMASSWGGTMKLTVD